MAEQALKRLLLAPFIMFAVLIIAIMAAFYLGLSGPGLIVFFVIALLSPAIGLKVAGKIFPGDNITLHGKDTKKS